MADPFNDDTEYDFHDLPGGYKEPYLATTKEQADSETNAMELLRQSMRRQAEVTPTQGLASALLAAVPTLGGYLIGKSVGTPDVSGLGINSFDEYKKIAGGTGGFAGGAMGAQIGAQSSGGYLQGLDQAQAEKADVLQKQAQLEAQKAARAQSEGASLLQAGLAKQAARDMIPFQEDSQIRIMQATEKARQQYGGGNDGASLELRKQEEARRQREQDARLSGGKPLNVPASTVAKVGAADSASAGQERLRELYAQAIQKLGPGAVQSVLRSAKAQIPGTIEAELLGTIKSVAMELNKAVDPTPSDAGMLAKYQELTATLESGHFLDALDFQVKNARNKALSELNVYASGSSPNAQAKSLVDNYSKKWESSGVSPSMQKSGGGGVDMPKREAFASPQEYLAALKAYNAK